MSMLVRCMQLNQVRRMSFLYENTMLYSLPKVLLDLKKYNKKHSWTPPLLPPKIKKKMWQVWYPYSTAILATMNTPRWQLVGSLYIQWRCCSRTLLSYIQFRKKYVHFPSIADSTGVHFNVTLYGWPQMIWGRTVKWPVHTIRVQLLYLLYR